jgi:hypothetical protein
MIAVYRLLKFLLHRTHSIWHCNNILRLARKYCLPIIKLVLLTKYALTYFTKTNGTEDITETTPTTTN